MKSITAPLMATRDSTIVRAVAVLAVLVPLAAIAGRLASNHNETFLGDPLA